ncbi:MAG: lysophospholipid acyltransferase family protein [Steroidobacteraceae bacterium]
MAEAATKAGALSGGASGPPEPFALRWRYALSRVVFFVGYRLLGLRRGVIARNLQRSFPALTPRERQRLVRDFVRRQSELFAEIDYARHMDADELRRRVVLLDPSGALAAPAAAVRQRVAVYVCGHQCNFEWLLLRLSLELGSDLIGLYKPLRGHRADRYFRGIRSRFGARLLPAKSVLRELDAIRRARVLGLVADQVPRTSPERHWMTFLRQPTAFFKGPERLARALRAPMAYVTMRRSQRGRYEIEIVPLTAAGERLPAGEPTERYARALERDIEADPAGWWWSHNRWKLQPPEPGAGQKLEVSS